MRPRVSWHAPNDVHQARLLFARFYRPSGKNQFSHFKQVNTMAAVSKCSGRSGFTDYLQNRRLPVSRADVRGMPEAGVTMALVEHAPSHGIEYDPVNELIISIVLRLNHEPVVRDLGYGEHRFTGASGQVLLTPPQKSSYWRFDSTP